MHKVNELLRELKIVRLDYFNTSFGLTKQGVGNLVKTSKNIDSGKNISATDLKYYKLARKSIISIYNKLVEIYEEEFLDEKDSRFIDVFHMKKVAELKNSGGLEDAIRQIDEIDNHLATLISEAGQGEKVGIPKKVDSEATQELETANLDPLDFEKRVAAFLAKPIR